MNNKKRIVAVLLMFLFAIVVKYVMTTVLFLQKTVLLLNHQDSILYTVSSNVFLVIEFFSIFFLLAIVVAILYQAYLSRNSNIIFKESSFYKSNMKILKGFTLMTLFIVLICGRCFTIVTPDKIYYSSFDTLFLTKSYDYSEINALDIESRKGRKSRYVLEYNITFGNHNINLLNSLEKDEDNKINKIHRNIIKNSKDVTMKENLAYKTKIILDRIRILTNLS